MSLLKTLGIRLPIVAAPMAGVSTPALCAAVSNAGALGSIAVGASSVDRVRSLIHEVRALTGAPFNLNLFCHAAPIRDAAREAAWLAALAPTFAELRAEPPKSLTPAYATFIDDEPMLAMLLEEKPPIVSFHFGLPKAAAIDALRRVGTRMIATATNVEEAHAVAEFGLDAVVAQGYEAGGHRGAFDPEATDDRLGTLALTRLIAARVGVPVIATGGIMDGAGIAAALALGAEAAQLGTAFVACPESAADASYRAALASERAEHTVMTALISGRLARSLPNALTNLKVGAVIPADYPVAYDAGKALVAAARSAGAAGFAVQWAGQGAPLARPLPAAELVAMLEAEWRAIKNRPAAGA